MVWLIFLLVTVAVWLCFLALMGFWVKAELDADEEKRKDIDEN